MSSTGMPAQTFGRRTWRLVRHDIGRKLTALAFALVLWTTLERVVVEEVSITLDVRVVSTREEAADRRASVPAVYLVVPDALLVRELKPTSITLQMKGPKDFVRNLTMSAMLVFDASMLGNESQKAFTYPLERELFKLRSSGDSASLTDFRVKPDALTVTLAPKLETDTTLTSLNVTTEGRPKDGYFFQESRIVVRPSQVRLSGPSAVIAAMRDDPKLPRLSPVRLEGRSTTVSQFVGLPQELIDQGVTLRTPENVVEVTIFLEAEDVSRDLLSQPVTYRNAAVLTTKSKPQQVSFATPALDLRVTGPPSELGQYSNEELAKRIDLQYDWRDATLDLARPFVRVFKNDLSSNVKVRMLADGGEPQIEYRLEELKDGP